MWIFSAYLLFLGLLQIKGYVVGVCGDFLAPKQSEDWAEAEQTNTKWNNIV